jgi:hypothetical protein
LSSASSLLLPRILALPTQSAEVRFLALPIRSEGRSPRAAQGRNSHVREASTNDGDGRSRHEADVVDRNGGRPIGAESGPPGLASRRTGVRQSRHPKCEQEIGFTRQFRESREASCPNDRTPDRIAAGLEAPLRPQVLGAAPRASRRPPRDKDHPNTG